MDEFLQLLANGLVTGSIIALGAVGLSLVYGILRIVNFAHGEYLTFGAFMAMLANVTWGANLAVAVLFGVLATAALGLLLELVLWRPLAARGSGSMSLFIVSIGLTLVLHHGILLAWGARPRRYRVDVFQVYNLGVLRLSRSQILAVAVAFAAIAGVGFFLARTRTGRALRAIADQRSLAGVAGVDVGRMSALTWVLASALAGLAGVLLALLQASFTPNLGVFLLLPIFAGVILGGIGSAYGALLGGLVLGLAMEVSTWDALAGGVPGIYKPVVAFAVLILLLLARPEGLLGRARALSS